MAKHGKTWRNIKHYLKETIDSQSASPTGELLAVTDLSLALLGQMVELTKLSCHSSSVRSHSFMNVT